ncbi:IPP transferase-domain-containing protein [Sporodiniella umbellata]|nr:IPP transferase-domain-containing protein [Sporodiniella umbellata]
MANKWHPSDRRKILRSLKIQNKIKKKKKKRIFHQTGQPQSEAIKNQKEQNEASGLVPRYRSLIFWIYSEPSKLNPRLDARVDQMIETGLFEEIKELRNRVTQGSVQVPEDALEKYQRGLWQAIGYKEFDPYFLALEEGKEGKDLSKIKDECTERMKAATRRYAKRQIQWIRNKILPTVVSSKGDDVLVYVLDANDIENWNTNVRDKAVQIAKAFQNDQPLPSPKELNSIAEEMLALPETAEDTQSRVLNWKKYVCDVCKTDKGEPLQLNGDIEWQQHKKGRFHRKYVKHLKVEAARKAYFESKKEQP